MPYFTWIDIKPDFAGCPVYLHSPLIDTFLYSRIDSIKKYSTASWPVCHLVLKSPGTAPKHTIRKIVNRIQKCRTQVKGIFAIFLVSNLHLSLCELNRNSAAGEEKKQWCFCYMIIISIYNIAIFLLGLARLTSKSTVSVISVTQEMWLLWKETIKLKGLNQHSHCTADIPGVTPWWHNVTLSCPYNPPNQILGIWSFHWTYAREYMICFTM